MISRKAYYREYYRFVKPPVEESGAAPSPRPPPPEGRGSIGAETRRRCRRTAAIPTSYPPPLGGGAGGGVSSGRLRRRPFRFCPTVAEESSAKGARRPLRNPARPPPPDPLPRRGGGASVRRRRTDAEEPPQFQRLTPLPLGEGQGEGYRREGSAAAHFGFARLLQRNPLQRARAPRCGIRRGPLPPTPSPGGEGEYRCGDAAPMPENRRNSNVLPPPLGGGAGEGVSSGRLRRRPFRFCPTFAEDSSAKGARRPLKNPARPPPPDPLPRRGGGVSVRRCRADAGEPAQFQRLTPLPLGEGQGEGYRREGSAAAHFGFARLLPRIPLQRGRYGAPPPRQPPRAAGSGGPGLPGPGIRTGCGPRPSLRVTGAARQAHRSRPAPCLGTAALRTAALRTAGRPAIRRGTACSWRAARWTRAPRRSRSAAG